MTSLPLFYSFGMSLITSNMLAGASVVVTPSVHSEREFWADDRLAEGHALRWCAHNLCHVEEAQVL